MARTNVHNPKYFHKVVDCQWACPAHTNVPGYIRLIAQGRYSDAFMLNRESNVFPGILGRTCDRPCEPACRRGRVEEKPVAICRLKRVAAECCVDPSTVTRAYQVLKRLGLIVRQDPGRDEANPFQQATAITEVRIPRALLTELHRAPNRHTRSSPSPAPAPTQPAPSAPPTAPLRTVPPASAAPPRSSDTTAPKDTRAAGP